MRRLTRLIAAAAAVTMLVGACTAAEPGSAVSVPTTQSSALAPTPTSSASESAEYPWHTSIPASMFYVGEKAGPDNNDQTNEEAAWCADWVACFGGVDDPKNRTTDGYWPAGPRPKSNPFYVALPCDEFGENDEHQKGFEEYADQIPWAPKGADGKTLLDYNGSILKNTWVEIVANGKTSYGRWQDTGPFEESGEVNNDCGYVFGKGDPRPANTWDLKAGIDLSPAIMKHLTGNASNGYVVVKWRFVADERTIPDGPWSIITTECPPDWVKC